MASNHQIPISTRAVLDDFKRVMTEDGLPFEKMILFGSRARGDADPDSDIDVMVVMPRVDSELRDAVYRAAWQAGFDHGEFIQVIPVTRKEMEEAPGRSSLLMMAIREEGIAL